MNSNKRMLAIVAGGGGAFVLLLLIFNSIVPAWKKTNAAVAALEGEIDDKERELRFIESEKFRRESGRVLPLPGPVERAASDYARFLKPLLHEAGLTVDEFQGPPPQEAKATVAGAKKSTTYIVLPYQVRAKGDLPSLAAALETMRRTPVQHRVRSLTLDRIDARDAIGKLGIQMTVDVMVAPQAKKGARLFPYPDSRLIPADALATLAGAPAGSVLFPWVSQGIPLTQAVEFDQVSRVRVDLEQFNPFLGEVPPPVVAKKEVEAPPVEPEGPDLREYIKLDAIEPSKEAFLRNTFYKMPPIRLKSTPMSGYEIFRIMDEERTKTILRAKVLRIDPRVVYFQVGEDIYGIRFGQTLADAMKRPLSQSELEESAVGDLYDVDFATPPEEKAKTRKKL